MSPRIALRRQTFQRVLASIALTAVLAPLVSCRTAVAPPPAVALPEAAPDVAEAAPPETRTDAALQDLLDAADRAVAEDRLTTPANHNAFDYYAQARRLAPAHARIRIGIERIVERYLALAQQAMQRQRWANVRLMLDRATIVDAEHPGIEPLRRQLRLLAGARRLTLALNQSAVRGRQPASAAKLATFGKPARQANARVTIRAANDADGRWIHQQLSNAHGTRRIRASLEIGLPPLVTIVLLPTSDEADREAVPGG